jgi:hypothetical protein
MAEAFCARGFNVTVVEQAPAVMPTVDLELGRLLGEELRRHDVQVVNDVAVKAIHPDARGLTVAGEPNFAATADLVLVVGVRPHTDLAVAAGAQTGAVCLHPQRRAPHRRHVPGGRPQRPRPGGPGRADCRTRRGVAPDDRRPSPPEDTVSNFWQTVLPPVLTAPVAYQGGLTRTTGEPRTGP